MKRFHKFVALACLLAAAWACIVFDFVDVGADENVKFVVRAFPWYSLMVLGCYALLCIGIDFMHFDDCNAASKELAGQIKQAKTELKAKGFTFIQDN